MNLELKNLLEELTRFGREKFPLDLLKKAYEQMEFEDLNHLIKKLLQWQKFAYTNLLVDGEINRDYMPMQQSLIPKIKTFFELCPEIGSCFQISGDKLMYLETLTEEEREEIGSFINDNYQLKVRIRRRPE